ncbi:MAG TPA: CDP-alcohol phosphatidyltransferase family protein [Pyrinomonadaceae bacterium]|nr:CDP-alcohol phosphatidyltransferase family protein [Pyrinomonadaceae bacterium]
MSSRIFTLPNFLTVIRMVLVPVFVTALYYQRFFWALAIFVFAGVTDGVDGFLARRFNQKSQLGTILDPIADKLLLVTSFITLSLASIVGRGNHLPVPFWVTAAVISRDVFIVVGAAAINIVTGFRGFRPSLLGKVNTVVQITAIIIILSMARFPALRGYVLPTVYAVVFASALFSGVHYIFHVARIMNEDRHDRDVPEDDL